MAEERFLFFYLLLNKAIIKSKTQAHESMTQILTNGLLLRERHGLLS